PERVPTLRLGLPGRRPPAPHADPRERDGEHGRVRDRAAAERGEDDVAPAGRRRAPAVDRDPEQYDRRCRIAVPTRDLKAVKRLAFSVRSSSIRSRSWLRRSPSASRTESSTSATGSSKRASATDVSPWVSRRSATCSLRRPPQVLRSVVTGADLYRPRRIRSNSVAVNSGDPGVRS